MKLHNIILPALFISAMLGQGSFSQAALVPATCGEAPIVQATQGVGTVLITGALRKDGSGKLVTASGTRVQITDRSTGRLLASGWTDGGGNFRGTVRGRVPGGSYRLRMDAEYGRLYHYTYIADFSFPGGGTKTFNRPVLR